jgi:cathepsin B
MTYSSMKRLMGSLETPEHILAQFDTVDAVAATIPTEFNATVEWPGCQSISEIRDQANCGSCWSFGAAEAMTDRYCIASN